jgi:hypothetical protein
MAGAANVQHIIIADRAIVRTLAVTWRCFVVIFLANIAALLKYLFINYSLLLKKNRTAFVPPFTEIVDGSTIVSLRLLTLGLLTLKLPKSSAQIASTGKAPSWH